MNKLQTVANHVNSNTNLNLLRDAELKMMPLVPISPLFAVLSNAKKPIIPILCISKNSCNLHIEYIIDLK